VSRLREIFARPWALEQRAARELAARLVRADRADPQAFFSLLGAGLTEESDLDVRDGVAVVPVRGSLMREPYFMSSRAKSWSYTGLRTRMEEALGREDVKAIVLDIDSPGGEAVGLAELSDFIYAARRSKPVDAVISGFGASAAYFIASAARSVFVARDAVVGSIGTILIVLDWSKFDEKQGLQEIHIVASQSPKKDPDATTDEGHAQLQTYVDAIADVFVGSVARNRGVSAQTVLSDFGGGDVMVGEAAVAAGLADGVATLGAVITARAQARPVEFERPLAAKEKR